MKVGRPAVPISVRLIDKFNIDQNGCWRWLGYKNRAGYGLFTVPDGTRSGASLPVHRLMYHLVRGPVPAALFVCHVCDVPDCCNPDHLFLGTTQDNTADKMEKGRGTKGETQGASKLTEADVMAIRQRRAQGETVRSIAQSLGVSSGAVWFAETGRTWRHLEGHRGAHRGNLVIQPRICELASCGRTYQPIRRKQKFCSHECGISYRNHSARTMRQSNERRV